MATSATKLLSEALALPRADRIELAEQLLRSLDDDSTETDPDELAYAKELERRAMAVVNGEAKLVPWDEFRAAALAELKARREARGR